MYKRYLNVEKLLIWENVLSISIPLSFIRFHIPLSHGYGGE